MIDEEIKLKRLSQAIEEDMTENELFEIARERRYRINDLQEENAELKEKLKGFENGEVVFIGHYEAVKCYPILKERFAELEAQIEKMKCCENCKYRIKKNLEGKIWVELCEKSYIKNKCEEWELAE